MTHSAVVTASFVALFAGVILILVGVGIGNFPVIFTGSLVMMISAGGPTFGANRIGPSESSAEAH